MGSKLSHHAVPLVPLKRRVRFTLLGWDKSGKSALLKYLAYYPSPVDSDEIKKHHCITDTMEGIGLNTTVLERGDIVITSFHLSTDEGLVDFHRKVLEKNKDGVIFMVDVRDQDTFKGNELGKLVGTMQEMPLLVLANRREQNGSHFLSVQDIEHNISGILRKHGKNSERCAVKEINVRSGDGIMDALHWLFNAASAT